MERMLNISNRRSFLEGFGLSAIGLSLGFNLYGAEATNEPAGDKDPKPKTSSKDQEKSSKGLNPNVFIHIASSGLVSIVCHRSEMGQGIRSSLPVLLADELGADMASVKIIQADGDKAYGDQNTDGSNSIRGIYDDMRRAAATARMMLEAEAGKRWNSPSKDLISEGGFVHNIKTKAKFGFGDLAEDAGRGKIPDPKDVVHRPDKELKHVGKILPLIDGPAYVEGKAIFGADVKLPNMLIAIIARPPVVGGKVSKFDSKAALAVNGVKKVVTMPVPSQPYIFQPWGGIAVIADNTWAAMKGRDALNVTWEHGPNETYNTPDFRKELEASVKKSGTVLRQLGDVEKSLGSAAKTLESSYFVPHIPHVSMEPPVAIARFSKENGGSCEVWAPTQNPQAAKTEVARILGLDESRVTVHVTLLGGGFGRKSKADFVSEAAFLAKELGVPVRVQWTRSDDIHNDYLNTISAQQISAGVDKKGKVVAWRHRTAFPPIGSLFNPKANVPGDGDLQQGVLDLALSVPNVTAEGCEANSHVRTGWLRSVYNIFHAFAINSFIDEIAHETKRDMKDLFLEMIGPDRKLTLEELGVKDLKNYGGALDKHPVDAGRLRNVINQVAKNSKWDKRKSLKGKALGLAAHRSFLSYVAVVAATSKRKDGSLWVEEVWVVIDAGKVVNVDRVRAQMEGSVLNSMNHALYGGVTHKNGAVEQSNFDGVRLIRMGDEPRQIHVEIMNSSLAPGGVGEPGVPPVAPAIANSIFALTKERIRHFPMLRQNS
ncbi:MAG: xanthine dehydrogenase family protein molybdopterin-binding subunit [Proteobacteria bacterium]|nr:MAG: xanthine dehydrogenase family protein molybdopterin-binding subunit [Pseudomonadota bacterium]